MDEPLHLSSMISKLEFKLKDTLKSNKNFEKQILCLENTLQKERLKIKILTFLLEKETDMNISSLFQEKENELTIQDSKGDISIIVRDELGEKLEGFSIPAFAIESENSSSSSSDDKDDKPRPHFRAVNKAPNEESLNKTEEKIKQAEESFNIFKNITDISVKETNEAMDKIFVSIQKSRMHKKDIEALRSLRFKLLGKFDVETYASLVLDHINKLKAIFVSKKYDNKKIIELIQQSLNGLDHRLSYFDYYYETHLLPDELQKLISALKIHTNYSKVYCPFDLDNTVNKFMNYGMAVMTLKENIIRVFGNPYKFFNLVYAQLPGINQQESPYSFYYLETAENSKRLWKMDCRLDETSKYLADQLKIYAIKLYRKIYYDVFNDNIYRPNFWEKTIIFREDLEQLLQNILHLTRRKDFCETLQYVLIQYCSIVPSISDKFNLMIDDKANKKKYACDFDYTEKILDVIEELFDDISIEDKKTFYDTKCMY